MRIRVPPLSPSRNAVTSLFLASLMIVSGIFAPFTAIAFLIPALSRLSTSALPSTIVIEVADSTSGPAGRSSGPYSSILAVFMDSETSLTISPVLGVSSRVHFLRIFLALWMISSLFVSLTSFIPSRIIFAEHGPTLSTLSIVAAMIDVAVLSKLEGIAILPVVLSFSEDISILILPILPVLCSSRRSRSGEKIPSVWPKSAPMTSGLSVTDFTMRQSSYSTTPSISNRASIEYLIINGSDFDFILI